MVTLVQSTHIDFVFFQLHMLEQVFAKLSFLPSIRKRASLLEHLADMEGKREKPSAIVLYVFPNSKDQTVWLKDSGGVLQKTSFSMLLVRVTLMVFYNLRM